MSDNDSSYFDEVKLRDPFNFIRAEEYFSQMAKSEVPNSIKYLSSDNDLKENPVCKYGRVFRFKDNALLLIEFLRPKVWRIRFSGDNENPTDFTEYNTRTLVQDTSSKLISVLDCSEQIKWRVDLLEDEQYYILQSIQQNSRGDLSAGETVVLEIWVQRKPFKLMAIRPVAPVPPTLKLPIAQNPTVTSSGPQMEEKDGLKKAIIWETDERGFQHSGKAAMLSVKTSSTAKYIGFGEQGGRYFFKEKTYMNYFNYDNMKYNNVYQNGPRDEREPLYHSEPYFIEVNGLPGYQSQVTTFIDNYSHVCIDLGAGKMGSVRVGTRFNDFQCLLFAADNMAEGIQLYTSVIGRPRLKPRYVLGHHQGCYGYMTGSKVEAVVKDYRDAKIPLDGMHIDVDIQRGYRTFTIDDSQEHFPKPKEMFERLRNKGVKCSTNITPFINSAPDPDYTTYNDGLAKNFFVMDRRDVDPSAPEPGQVRYLQFSSGAERNPYTINPKFPPRYINPDTVKFSEVYNSDSKPFHGGVSYGPDKAGLDRGASGVYPNLNNFEVRRWWGEQYKYLFDCGLEFVWQDMTSPCMAQQYGDMKSFPFRLLLDSDYRGEDPRAGIQRKAIEIWSLYSYNLHKATYKGLNHLPSRENKRNFIIGRGSFAGMHRFAGLWTGDNASTWDFLDISVAQVLSLGLSGVTIAGADVGGFESAPGQDSFADPELLIRWYCAYSLLPWFRNHYKGTARDGKLFQEPYEYANYLSNPKWNIPTDEMEVYRSVLPVCRYNIQLRYSLLQLMYDAMFENLITGLPIARSMVITDPLDASLYAQNMRFVRGQYLVGKDLLVAPQLLSKREHRILYLPYPDSWYPMNLRPGDALGEPLLPRINGGSQQNYYCPIRSDEQYLPYTTPMYIREGAIIPKIEFRPYIPDPTLPGLNNEPNTITLHIYPGKDNTYNMYLDDGVSRASAPDAVYLSNIPNDKGDSKDAKLLFDAHGDSKAANQFCQVNISQKSKINSADEDQKLERAIAIKSPWNNYPGKLEDAIGTHYRVCIWHDSWVAKEPLLRTPFEQQSHAQRPEGPPFATTVMVPIAEANTKSGIEFSLFYDISCSLYQGHEY